MKKLSAPISSGLMVSMGILVLTAMALPAQAQKYQYNQNRKNYVAPSISFGDSTAIGATSKFGLAGNISARPFLILGSGASSYGASLTYDLNLDTGEGQSYGFTPYGGVGLIGASSFGNSGTGIYFEIGADYNASESLVINANHRFNGGGFTSVGAGFKF
jgi:hypothetical protein